MNLEVNDPVRFATAGNQLYVVDRKGKTHVLKYLRRETSADRCAKTARPQAPRRSQPKPARGNSKRQEEN